MKLPVLGTALFSRWVTERTPRWLPLLRAFVLLAALLALVKLFIQIAYVIQLPAYGDSDYYFTVGRGILNGLQPYRDLFETKPPGIFLLAAASLALTKGALLVAAVQALSIVVIAGVPVLLALSQTRERRAFERALWFFISMGIGLSLALYTAHRSPEIQTEPIGAMFASLFVLVAARRRLGVGWILVAAGLLLLAILMKEPFLLSALAAAVSLHLRHLRRLIRAIVLPACIAFLMGIVLLAVLGFLDAYVGVYLPHMFGIRLQEHGSLLPRGLAWNRVLLDLRQFAPSFAVTILLLCLVPILPLCRELMRTRRGMLSLLTLALGAYIFWHAIILTLYIRFQVHAATIVIFLGIASLGVLVGLTGALASAGRSLRMYILATVLGLPLVVYLSVLAVGAGGDFINHHFIFAVPVYAAAAAACIRLLADRMHLLESRVAAFMLAALSFVQLLTVMPSYDADRLTEWRRGDADVKRLAERFDALLDACRTDRYLIAGLSSIWRYTRHSPLGPGFVQFKWNRDPARPHFYSSYALNLQTTDVVIAHRGFSADDQSPVLRHYLASRFTLVPPPCAFGHSLPELTIFFSTALAGAQPGALPR